VQQEPAADDLTVIVGIGPTIAARLNQAGITSLAAMMASSPERVAAAAKVSEERASGWMKQAAVLQA
jgi:predicted flap endonuclease-1-like 5' DNA nuclease